ncbi:substrate-binding protein [Marinimicrobium locisalis]|uniref:substrate-binding protein n=1 Tax=Marinimicrobium locisalis TaxID=546022 RepID=UPI003221BF28
MNIRLFLVTTATAALLTVTGMAAAEDEVVIGLNYPETGPYQVQGLAQNRAADMAVEEINSEGGILGKKIRLVKMDTASQADKSATNVAELIDEHGAKMVFGGSSSAVAISGGKAAKERDTLYFGTLTYSNATTGTEGHTHMFRESNNAWMAAKVLSAYLKENFSGKSYYYVTADYTWGWSTEESIRRFSDTTDQEKHKGVKTPFPGATARDFNRALTLAKSSKPDVLVLVLFGNDMAVALNEATRMGLKRSMEVVVPNLTLGMAESAGPKVMEGVVGSLPWSWNLPYEKNYPRGKKFVEDFAERYKGYPSTSGASAYTILYEYKAAVERAESFETADLIKTLEGHEYTLLKDAQTWRAFDHQSVQSVYAVKGKPQAEVLADKFNQDYFEIIASMPGEEAARTKEEWVEARKKAGKPATLQ